MVSDIEASAITRDTLWGGQLVFWQPARGAGYRFNLDPVLLAGFVRPAHHVLDLGAGCGIVASLLLAEGKAEKVTCVEIQPHLAQLAARNAEENGFGTRTRVLDGDLRQLELPRVDAVVFNPPYFRVGEGRTSPAPGRDIARRERHGTLGDFVGRGLEALSNGGAQYCIVRVDRSDELCELARSFGASICRSRTVMARIDAPARHILVEIQMGAHHRVEEEPLVVHVENEYSTEVRRWLRE